MTQPPTPASLVTRLREQVTAFNGEAKIIVAEDTLAALVQDLREAADTLEASEHEVASYQREVARWAEKLDAADTELTEARQERDGEHQFAVELAADLAEARQALEAAQAELTTAIKEGRIEMMLPDMRERLAALTAENKRLKVVLTEVSEYLDGSNYATDSGDLPEIVRAAIDLPPS